MEKENLELLLLQVSLWYVLVYVDINASIYMHTYIHT